MQRSEFQYELPDELIAQSPLAERADSRLLELCGADGAITHRSFRDLPKLLRAGDLLVFNDTRVLPARLYGVKETGGRVEILIERLLSDRSLLAHVRASKSPKPGSKITLVKEPDAEVGVERSGDIGGEKGGEKRGETAGQHVFTVSGREGELFALASADPVAPIMAEFGHMPLPPYIDRSDAEEDRERYQTVYARRDGAVAAPTAGLHFDTQMLDAIDKMGVLSTTVTLHVGAGTFQPVRADDIRDHHIHHEWLEVSDAACEAVRSAKADKRRVIAVGTTAVRSLETAAASGEIAPYSGDTNLFIYPGYRFNCVDAMVTNFHLPESTLLMLVSAFCGQTEIMAAYQEAVRERYRFFSYGDAMFLTPKDGVT